MHNGNIQYGSFQYGFFFTLENCGCVPRLPKQTQYQLRYAQNEVAGEKAYCPGKDLLLLHSTARLHVDNKV